MEPRTTDTGADDDRRPDQRDPRDTDRVVPRTDAPRSDPGDSGFDPDAPGNFVDDHESPSVPEPNEPA